jgi:hypothetical protein
MTDPKVPMSDAAPKVRPSRFGTRDLVATFGVGRRCADEDCGTVLSQYNDDERCGVHAA